MNTETRKTINELFELCDKYIEQGENEKARECLKKINELNNNTWEENKNEINKTLEYAGLSIEDFEK